MYKDGTKKVNDLFNGLIGLFGKAQENQQKQSSKLLDLAGDLTRRKSESDSKQLTELAIKGAFGLGVVYFGYKAFKKGK